MSISCEKTFTLHIDAGCYVPSNYFYWPMDELGAVNRVDIVQGAVLQNMSTDDPVTDVPGMHDRAVHVSAAIGIPGGLSSSPSQDPKFAVNPTTSWSVCGWLHIVDLGNLTASMTIRFILAHAGIDTDVYIYASATPTYLFYASNGVSSATVGLPLVVGAWTFFHIFYDAPNTRVGVQIGNNAPSYPALVVNCPATLGATLSLSQAKISGGYYVDDLIVRMDDKFSQNQLDYLYNEGDGRAWPFCIPEAIPDEP